MKKPGKMLREVLRAAMRKPVTTRYPAEPLTMPDRFRGKIVFRADRCVGCRLCMRDCPAGAIAIRKVGEKQYEADFDFSRCIYCAQCVDSCLKKALEATGEFELAQVDRSKLRITYHGDPKTQSGEKAPAGPAGGEPPAKA